MEANKNVIPERPAVIEWKTEKSECNMEQVSPDGRWHLSTRTARDGKQQVYLSNFDLLCSPSSRGGSAMDCWRKFLDSCDDYVLRIAAIRAEAAAILAKLEQSEQ